LLMMKWDRKTMQPKSVEYGRHLRRAFEEFGGVKAVRPIQMNTKEAVILREIGERLLRRNEASN